MNIEDAYRTIAEGCLYVVGDLAWDKIVMNAEVGETMVSRTVQVLSGETTKLASGTVPLEFELQLTDAQFLLRDDLLRTTGDRIWGFTFTLYKEGRFEIEYDYTMPDEYKD